MQLAGTALVPWEARDKEYLFHKSDYSTGFEFQWRLQAFDLRLQ